MKEKPLFSLFTNSFDFTKRRFNLRLAASVAVVGDSEAVGLIPDSLKDFKSLGVSVYEERIWVPHPDDFFKPFGKSYDGEALGKS